MRKKVTYHIYRKTTGLPYPGEHWEGPLTLTNVRIRFKDVYQDVQNGKPTRKQTFRIVKVIEEAITP